jgi:hypothetical protein
MIKKTDRKTTVKRTRRQIPPTEELAVTICPPVHSDGYDRNRTDPALELKLMIHGWLTDIWLLSTGEAGSREESHAAHYPSNPCYHESHWSGSHWSHGRPLALVSDGQMRLLSSRDVTLDALRDVGIEIS